MKWLGRMTHSECLFLQIIIQEKYGGGDFRSSLIFRDRLGGRWKIRGYGNTPQQAAEDVYLEFLSDDFDYEEYFDEAP